MADMREDDHISLDEPLSSREVLKWAEKVIEDIVEKQAKTIREIRRTTVLIWFIFLVLEMVRQISIF